MFNQDQNPFEILGIEPSFDIDLMALNQAYFQRQSLVHPDRFIYQSGPEREAASAQASALNGAYEILKNPLLRAKELLKIRGIEFDDAERKTIQDPEILEEMMDLQDALSQAAIPHDLSKLESDIKEKLQEVKAAFAHALQNNQHAELMQIFLRFTYLSKLKADIKVRQRQSSLKVL